MALAKLRSHLLSSLLTIGILTPDSGTLIFCHVNVDIRSTRQTSDARGRNAVRLIPSV